MSIYQKFYMMYKPAVKKEEQKNIIGIVLRPFSIAVVLAA